MKKSILFIALSVLTLTSCGGNISDNVKSSDSTPTASTEKETTKVEPTTKTETTTEAQTTEAPTTVEEETGETILIDLVNPHNTAITGTNQAIENYTAEKFASEYVKNEKVVVTGIEGCGTVSPNHEDMQNSVVKIGSNKKDGLLDFTLKEGETLKKAEITISRYFKSYKKVNDVFWSIDDMGENFKVNDVEKALPELVEDAAQPKQTYTISDATIVGKDKFTVSCGKKGERICIYSIKLTLN